jgi:hypothetical protein
MFVIRTKSYQSPDPNTVCVVGDEDGLEDPDSEPMLIGVEADVPMMQWKGAKARWHDRDWEVEHAREVNSYFTSSVMSGMYTAAYMLPPPTILPPPKPVLQTMPKTAILGTVSNNGVSFTSNFIPPPNGYEVTLKRIFKEQL